MLIGRWGGLSAKKHGAAKFMERGVLARLAVRQLPSRMTALLDMQIGWQDGVWVRRLGAARTRARAAHQQQEDVLETKFFIQEDIILMS